MIGRLAVRFADRYATAPIRVTARTATATTVFAVRLNASYGVDVADGATTSRRKRLSPTPKARSIQTSPLIWYPFESDWFSCVRSQFTSRSWMMAYEGYGTQNVAFVM